MDQLLFNVTLLRGKIEDWRCFNMKMIVNKRLGYERLSYEDTAADM